MGVETKSGLYIPTTTECDNALGLNKPDISQWSCYIAEGSIHLCNGCGGHIDSDEWEEHIHTCEPMGKWIKEHVRISPER